MQLAKLWECLAAFLSSQITGRELNIIFPLLLAIENYFSVSHQALIMLINCPVKIDTSFSAANARENSFPEENCLWVGMRDILSTDSLKITTRKRNYASILLLNTSIIPVTETQGSCELEIIPSHGQGGW